MDKDDKFDNFLTKLLKSAQDEIIPPKEECPNEAFLKKYAYGKLNQEGINYIEEHLVSCNECLETLEAIRMVEEAERSPEKMPPRLYKMARQILQPVTISLLWDQIRDKITQITPNLREMIIPKEGGWLVADSEFQVVRDSRFEKDSQAFPYKTSKKVKQGKIFLEIDRSEKESLLILKVFFHFIPERPFTDVRATLYKLGKIYSSVNLDERGRAFFHLIKEGKYHLEFLEGDEPLETIELSILTIKNE